MGKDFKEQTKTIKDQEEKQIKAIEDNTNKHSYKNTLLLSKEKMLKNIYNKRLHKIEALTKNINYNDLKCIVQSTGEKTDFTKVMDPIVFLDYIGTGKITPEKAKNLQEEINKYLKKIRIGKNEEQKQKFRKY